MITTSTVEFEAEGVELDSDHDVLLGTIEADKNYFPEKAILRFTEDMTGIAVTSISIGTNAPNYNNIMSSLALTVGDDTARKIDIMTGGGLVGAVVGAAPSGTEVYARVNHTSGSGGKATVSLIGFIDPV